MGEGQPGPGHLMPAQSRHREGDGDTYSRVISKVIRLHGPGPSSHLATSAACDYLYEATTHGTVQSNCD